MAFDFKKEYKEFYLPPKEPQIVTVPKMQFVAVRGKGNPNEEDGEYKAALAVLYAVSYTLKMSKMGDHRIEGYFDYVVPPLEGFWWQIKDGTVVSGFNYSDKSSFNWLSVIRLPDFVTQKDFDWAKATAATKKGLDCSRAELLTLEEGECVQIMHTGSYDDEPATIKLMDDFALANGYTLDFSATTPEKLKTVIRHPVKRIQQEQP